MAVPVRIANVVALVGALGTGVGMAGAAWAQVPNAMRDGGGAAIGLEVYPPMPRAGEPASVCMSTSAPGYLSLWNFTRDGRVTRVFPGGGAVAMPVAPGQRACLGDPSSNHQVTFSDPGKVEHFVALWTQGPEYQPVTAGALAPVEFTGYQQRLRSLPPQLWASLDANVAVAGAGAPGPVAGLPNAGPATVAMWDASGAPPLFTAPMDARALPMPQMNHVQELLRRPTTRRAQVVALQPETFNGMNARAGGLPVVFNLFPDVTVAANPVPMPTVNQRFFGGTAWHADLAGGNGDAIMVAEGDRLTGTVTVGDDVYSIQPLGNGLHAVVQRDFTRMPMDDPPGFEAAALDAQARAAQQPQPAAGAAEYNMGREDAPAVINVLVAYTPAAEKAAGDIKQMIRLAVEESNQSYKGSHVRLELRLTEAVRVNHKETPVAAGGMMNDLKLLAGKGDGVMDELHQIRDRTKSDIVVLMENIDEACGVANAIGASPGTAFALVATECATGYYSFGHEIGHLLGVRHDVAADKTPAPFPFGHGYVTPQWRDIMGYGQACNNCKREKIWSNPGIQHRGRPAGVARESDTARVLNITGMIVSGFR